MSLLDEEKKEQDRDAKQGMSEAVQGDVVAQLDDGEGVAPASDAQRSCAADSNSITDEQPNVDSSIEEELEDSKGTQNQDQTESISSHEAERLADDAVTRKASPLIFGLTIAAAAVIGLIGMFLAFPIIAGGTPEQINQVRLHVNQLYASDKHEFLAADVTAEKLAAIKQEVDGIHGLAHLMLKGDWQKASDCYQAIEALNQIYQSDSLLIQGEKVRQAPPLKEGVALAQVKALRDAPVVKRLNKKAGLGQAIDKLIGQAEATLGHVQEIQQALEQMQLATSTDEAVISTEIAQILKLEEQIKSIEASINTDALVKLLADKAESFGQTILNHADKAQYSQATIDQLFASDVVAKKLSGSKLDTRKLMTLTFDDGPNPEVTEKLLAVLRKHNVKATFFMMGGYVEKYPDIVRAVRDEGHQIGNHTYTHPDMATLSDDEVKKQIQYAQEVIEEAAGVVPTIYRLPFGSGGQRVVNLLKPMTSIVWNVDSEDWKSHDKHMIIDRVLSTLQPRTVLLMHDTHISTVEAIDELIPIFKKKGYQFVFPQENDLGYYYY